MTTVPRDRVSVILVGLDGFTESSLCDALSHDDALEVVRFPEDLAASAAPPEQSILVVGATASSLRTATAMLHGHQRVIATLALTSEPPGSDVYFVAPAARDVVIAELADMLRDLARGGRADAVPFAQIPRDLNRSDR